MKKQTIRCPYCGSPAILKDASYVYGSPSHLMQELRSEMPFMITGGTAGREKTRSVLWMQSLLPKTAVLMSRNLCFIKQTY